jgi:hypothetical protein
MVSPTVKRAVGSRVEAGSVVRSLQGRPFTHRGRRAARFSLLVAESKDDSGAGEAGSLAVGGGCTRGAARTHLPNLDRTDGAADGLEQQVEDLFRKELERRRVSSIDDLGGGEGGPRVRRKPPPPFARDLGGQLERSRKLNSEGLEVGPDCCMHCKRVAGGRGSLNRTDAK